MADLLETLPKRVKVGIYTFAIRPVLPGHVELQTDKNTPAWGMTDLDANRIWLDKTMPLDRMVNTLWHEVTHAIHSVYGIDDGASEEAVACQGANGWMQVNLDNPKLELWFHRAWQQLRKAR